MNKIDYDFCRCLVRQMALFSGQSKKYKLLSSKDILTTETHMKINKQLFQYTPLTAKLDQQNRTLKEHGKKIVQVIEK